MTQPRTIDELYHNEEIFVDIREQVANLEDKYSGRTVNLEQYRMLYSCPGGLKDADTRDFRFLDLGEVRNGGPKHNNKARTCFWLRNSELLQLMAGVVDRFMTGTHYAKKASLTTSPFLASDVRDYLKLSVFTINPDRNWYCLLVDLGAIRHIFEDSEILKYIHVLEQEGYRLYLTAENSFSRNASPNVYLQIASIHQSRNGIHEYLSGLLTIAKTELRIKFRRDPGKLEELFGRNSLDFGKYCEEISLKFLRSLRNLTWLFRAMEDIKLNEDTYNAVALDLFDLNRNIASVRHDTALQKRLKNTISKCHRGIEGRNFSWATLIHSVVHNNYSTLRKRSSKEASEVSHLFSRKEIIEKMERIYDSIWREGPTGNASEKALDEYISNQVRSYKEVEQFITKR